MVAGTGEVGSSQVGTLIDVARKSDLRIVQQWNRLSHKELARGIQRRLMIFC